MTIFKAIILGAVQGFAEFLPISSSGHLVIFSHLLKTTSGGQDLFFDVLLHLGTFVAVVIAFWKDILRLILELFSVIGDLFTGRLGKRKRSPGRNYLYMLIVALLPLFLVLPVKSKIEALFDNPVFVGCALLVTGAILWFSGRLRRGSIGMAETRVGNALTVGFAQLFAIVPGISRSGTTITAGLMTGFKREYAVKFSFIISLPATLAAAVLELYETIKLDALPDNMLPYLIGMVVAAFTGYLAIGLVRLLLKKNQFQLFSGYCLAMGMATIIYFGLIY